ncbi:hypothetical protein ABC426_11885 [Lactiplantibacillus plantarum]|uniref:hypothetical protein n=1 Tax=Lactiplantibacillus plantarum TaxID=1590 RepID=UPI001BA8E0C4|nr:hypothetical protein [Lactiplantibacillus plantarum]MBS0950719.1 hypothetical protein [Lactiplantibacillus plantarum]
MTMSQAYFFDSHKPFDQKAGIFVHHHGASIYPTVNLTNYRDYINNELDLVETMGYRHIETPFTHVTDENSEFVTVAQYLVEEALNRNLTVMVIAQGTQDSSMSDNEIKSDSQNYLQVMTNFVIKNAGKFLIYEGLNEPESSNWYGQNTMQGYQQAMLWDNKLKAVVNRYDSTATFVEGVINPIYGIPLIKQGLINPAAYAIHSYVKNIGTKGNNVPEAQLLNATYPTSYNGHKFAMTEFGIAAEYDGSDNEDDWQGIVSADEAAALTVRQMIIQDALGAPMQYNFILGYLYVFKKYQFFDLNANITPTGTAVKNALEELQGYYFHAWLWTDVGTHHSYIAKYIDKDGLAKYAYWNADGSSADIIVGTNTLHATSAPQFTITNLEASVNTLVVQTPVGLSTIDVKNLPINQSVPLQLPHVEGYQHNEINATLDGTGKLTLEGDIIYRKADESGLKVQAKNLNGSFKNLKLKSPDGTSWQAVVVAGNISWVKNQGNVI